MKKHTERKAEDSQTNTIINSHSTERRKLEMLTLQGMPITRDKQMADVIQGKSYKIFEVDSSSVLQD